MCIREYVIDGRLNKNEQNVSAGRQLAMIGLHKTFICAG